MMIIMNRKIESVGEYSVENMFVCSIIFIENTTILFPNISHVKNSFFLEKKNF